MPLPSRADNQKVGSCHLKVGRFTEPPGPDWVLRAIEANRPYLPQDFILEIYETRNRGKRHRDNRSPIAVDSPHDAAERPRNAHRFSRIASANNWSTLRTPPTDGASADRGWNRLPDKCRARCCSNSRCGRARRWSGAASDRPLRFGHRPSKCHYRWRNDRRARFSSGEHAGGNNRKCVRYPAVCHCCVRQWIASDAALPVPGRFHFSQTAKGTDK